MVRGKGIEDLDTNLGGGRGRAGVAGDWTAGLEDEKENPVLVQLRWAIGKAKCLIWGLIHAVCSPGSLPDLCSLPRFRINMSFLENGKIGAFVWMCRELRRLGSQSERVGEMSGLHDTYANGTQSVVAFLKSG